MSTIIAHSFLIKVGSISCYAGEVATWNRCGRRTISSAFLDLEYLQNQSTSSSSIEQFDVVRAMQADDLENRN